MKKAIFYHAGCPVCVEAEGMVAQAIDRNQYALEVVHFAQHPDRVAEAEAAGVKSVPALLLDNQVFHINFGASMADVKKAS
jgi:glutaredoxin